MHVKIVHILNARTFFKFSISFFEFIHKNIQFILLYLTVKQHLIKIYTFRI